MKNRKKLLVWLLCVTLIGLLVACGREAGDVTTATPETTGSKIEDTTEETIEETTEAPTEPPTRQVTEIKVGMIFYGEENEGSLLADSLRQEMMEAASVLGMNEDQILMKYNSREADWTQIEESILACIDEGCQLILGCAREYEAVIAAIAEEYPDVMFACVGSTLYNGINSGTFTMDVGAAQYLQGALAGFMTDTNRVGFVAAKDKNDEAVTQAVNAFAYGVWSTNPDAIVDVAVIGKWFLPGAENHGREYLDGLGCDEIGSYTDVSIGELEYQWQQYFSMKLEQIIQKEVIGEAWCGNYYTGAVTSSLTAELPEYVWGELAKWGTMMEEMPQETLPESEDPSEGESQLEQESTLEETVVDTTSQDETVLDETVIGEIELEETETEEAETEETEPPYEIPDIDIDRDTGYLSNVRIHKIDWEE